MLESLLSRNAPFSQVLYGLKFQIILGQFLSCLYIPSRYQVSICVSRILRNRCLVGVIDEMRYIKVDMPLLARLIKESPPLNFMLLFLIQRVELLLSKVHVEQGTRGINERAFRNILVGKKSDTMML
ncbi:MAG: hypothetical protein JWL87_488 [Candidatus Adlerbacteria bacterium]|nr:hypothetical protein [Candidatus Adlerbacteria bacterium]